MVVLFCTVFSQGLALSTHMSVLVHHWNVWCVREFKAEPKVRRLLMTNNPPPRRRPHIDGCWSLFSSHCCQFLTLPRGPSEHHSFMMFQYDEVDTFPCIESIHSFTPCFAKIDSSGHEWSLYRMYGIHSRTLASCSDTCTLTQVHHPLSELELILIPLAKLNSFISRKGGLVAIIDLWSVWLHSNGKVMAWCRSCCCWRCFGFWIFAKKDFWPGMWRGRIWDARSLPFYLPSRISDSLRTLTCSRKSFMVRLKGRYRWKGRIWGP